MFHGLPVVAGFLELLRAGCACCMMNSSPVLSSNGSTSSRPQTRSVTSRDDYLSNPDKLAFLQDPGKLGETVPPSLDYVNGTFSKYLALLFHIVLKELSRNSLLIMSLIDISLM